MNKDGRPPSISKRFFFFLIFKLVDVKQVTAFCVSEIPFLFAPVRR